MIKSGYRLAELAAITGKTEALMSLKLRGKIRWTVDEIRSLYDALGDDAWVIYDDSLYNRLTAEHDKKSKKTKEEK